MSVEPADTEMAQHKNVGVLMHPVFMCGFRPFFLLTGASAVVFMLSWLALLAGWSGVRWLGVIPGGAISWHAHEMLFGFGAAAIAGFVLTAIPEFTAAAGVSRRHLMVLVLLWLAARCAYLLAAWWPSGIGLWPAALFNVLFWLGLLIAIMPAVWSDPQRRHISFGWILAALAVLQLGFFVSLSREGHALAWLHAAVGALMVLIVVSVSRISMSVMNRRVELGRDGNERSGEPVYLARPPRRKLAIFTVALCSIVEFAIGHNAVTGWTALAAAAAMFNLLNDWHVGRHLFTRWAFMLYISYWLLALGYAVMGLAWLGAPLTVAAGRHILMAGAMTLAILTVMNIAGRIHAGRWLDRRAWFLWAGAGVVAAALVRGMAGVGMFAAYTPLLWWLSGLIWASVFIVYLWYAYPVLAGPRTDGGEACEGPGSTAV